MALTLSISIRISTGINIVHTDQDPHSDSVTLQLKVIGEVDIFATMDITKKDSSWYVTLAEIYKRKIYSVALYF